MTADKTALRSFQVNVPEAELTELRVTVCWEVLLPKLRGVLPARGELPGGVGAGTTGFMTNARRNDLEK